MNCARVAGNMMIDDAKMGGMTPDVLILSGRCVVCPPYIFLPTIRFAYCTGMRRCPVSMNTMTPTTATMKTARKITARIPISPVDTSRKVLITPSGPRQTMPAKMMSEMPLPIPRSVICSPSHMMKAVPAVSVMTVMRRKPQPGIMTMEAPVGPAMFSRPTAIPKPWMRERSTVP